jgi:hypothetical protein
MIYNGFRREHLLENEIFMDSPEPAFHFCPTSLWRLQTEGTRGEEDTG